MSNAPDHRWIAAIDIAEQTGRTAELVDLLMDPRVDIEDVGRFALAGLLSRKVLRDPRPNHVRNALARKHYEQLRDEGWARSDAMEIVKKKYGMDHDALIGVLNRSQRDFSWGPSTLSGESLPLDDFEQPLRE